MGHDAYQLMIELVPASSWGMNLRTMFSKSIWEQLRAFTFNTYAHQCAVCEKKGSLHCHEVWIYDDENHIQSLKKLQALCPLCHGIKHIGLSGLQQSGPDMDQLITHFMKVNQCSRADFTRHYQEQMDMHHKRSRYEWDVTIEGFLEKFEKEHI